QQEVADHAQVDGGAFADVQPGVHLHASRVEVLSGYDTGHEAGRIGRPGQTQFDLVAPPNPGRATVGRAEHLDSAATRPGQARTPVRERWLGGAERGAAHGEGVPGDPDGVARAGPGCRGDVVVEHDAESGEVAGAGGQQRVVDRCAERVAADQAQADRTAVDL